MIFNMYIAELNKCLDERGIGGIKLRKNRIWTLSCADDLVILTKNRDIMIDIIGTLDDF